MSSSPDASVTCAGSGNAQDAEVYTAMVFRGVDTSTPIDAATTTDKGTTSLPNSPSIVSVTDGAAIISCFALNKNTTIDSPPSLYGDTVGTAKASSDVLTAGAAWAAKELAGTENPGTWGTGNNGTWAAFTIALRPAIASVNHDGAGSFTGLAAVGMKASDSGGLYFSSAGSAVVSFAGQTISTLAAALSATGSAAMGMVGLPLGDAEMNMTGSAAVSWVGNPEYMTSVRDDIQSVGRLAVTVH